MNIHRLDGTLWLAASCKLQQYDNEGCKTCASLAGLVASFIVVVIDPLRMSVRECCEVVGLETANRLDLDLQ